MTQIFRILWFVSLSLAAATLAGCTSTPRVSDGRSHAEHRDIAMACASLLRSARTNETQITPVDPRVPTVIRALAPHEILVVGRPEDGTQMLVLIRAGTPAIYQFWPRFSYPKPWILFVAGPGYEGLEELDYSGSMGYESISDL